MQSVVACGVVLSTCDPLVGWAWVIRADATHVLLLHPLLHPLLHLLAVAVAVTPGHRTLARRRSIRRGGVMAGMRATKTWT